MFTILIFILYSIIFNIWIYYKMPRRLSKKKTLKGGWPGTKPKPIKKKINTLKGGWGNSENNLPLEEKKPKEQSKNKKKSKKSIKGPMKGGPWRSRSIFF